MSLLKMPYKDNNLTTRAIFMSRFALGLLLFFFQSLISETIFISYQNIYTILVFILLDLSCVKKKTILKWKLQKGQSQRTGTAEVKPYGGHEKNGKLFPI